MAGLLLARSRLTAHERYFTLGILLSGCFHEPFFHFRDVGMISNLEYFSSISSLIICSTLIFVAVKGVPYPSPPLSFRGLSLRTAIITGLTLAQVGEFFFLCLPLRAFLPPFSICPLPDFFFAVKRCLP